MCKADIVALTQGTRIPLFAIHAAGGVLSFGKLARALDRDQPMYLVKGKGVDNPDPSFKDLHDLADHYVEGILEICPDGPFLLCGRETFILIEVGLRLLALGKEVPATIVFDTAPPAKHSFIKKTRRRQPKTIRGRLYRTYTLVRQRLPAIRNKDSEKTIRQRYDEGTLVIAGIKVGRNNPDQPGMINKKLGIDRHPEHYRAKIVYLQSEAYKHDARRALHIDRWRAFADEVDVHVTPGSHSTMFDKPNVSVLAHLVCAACTEAVADSRTGG